MDKETDQETTNKETAEAATKIQKGFRAKRSARGKPSPSTDSTGSADQQRAASKIQASFRRRGKAAKESLQKVGKVGREAKESIDASATVAQGRLLNTLIAKGLTKGIKVAVATDPWIPKSVAKALPPPLSSPS